MRKIPRPASGRPKSRSVKNSSWANRSHRDDFRLSSPTCSMCCCPLKSRRRASTSDRSSRSSRRSSRTACRGPTTSRSRASSRRSFAMPARCRRRSRSSMAARASGSRPHSSSGSRSDGQAFAKAGATDLAIYLARGRSAATTVSATGVLAAPRRHPRVRDRRHRRRPSRRRRRRLARSRRAREHADRGRVRRSQSHPRSATHARAARDARRAGDRLPHRRAPRVLHRAQRLAALALHRRRPRARRDPARSLGRPRWWRRR